MQIVNNKLSDSKYQDIRKACEVMRRGGVILYPTDTVWGIGCDATNAQAVQRIYDIKQRTDSKAMLVLVDNDAKIQQYVKTVPDVAWDLIDLSEKPLTIIFDGARSLAENLIAADGSIGIRVTREEFSRQLCYHFRKPVVSTSANISGQPAANNFCDIVPELLESVDYVCESRRKEKGKHKPSSIIKLGARGEIQIIRP